MEEEQKKFNPYLIIIIVLVLAVGVFVYDKWGGGFLSNTENNQGQEAPTTNVDTKIAKEDIVIGNEDAPVTIVEYYSYLCGYCKLFHDETYSKIVENYISSGKVKYVFRAFPPYELGAAVLCANDQGKFLEYHDELFGKSADIQQVDDLKTLAKDAGLDETQFNECFDSQKYLTKAQEWYQQADKSFEEAGVPAEQRGTPSFFINGELLVGAKPYDNFVEVIERKLGE